MPELDDYSGPFKPDLKLEDLSKDFLIKLIREYQWAWVIMADSWYYAIKKRFGREAANQCELESWCQVADKVNPYYAKLANIQLTDAVSCMKAMQLPLDSHLAYIPCTYEIKSNNHIILTVQNCQGLEFFEREDPERIQWMCHVVEAQAGKKYLIHPDIKFTPLKLPPRKSKDEIACQWEIKLEK
jgi:hypothetical protein